jgi:hypothetical protein
MAANVLASMLDELMGRDRNLAPSDRKNDTRWDDSEVKIYDVKFKHPYMLHKRTKYDVLSRDLLLCIVVSLANLCI